MIQHRFWRLFIFLGLLGWTGCTTVTDQKIQTPSPHVSLSIENKNLLDQLHANQTELARIYKEIQPISEGNLFYGSDEQLNIIQKASLYILSSHRLARHQEELLSFFTDIRADRQKEYRSFLVKGLKRSVFEAASELNSLNTYYALSENDTARELIDQAVELIRKNMNIYKQLSSDL